MLEAGARALQTGAPTSRLDLHLTGIHPLKGMAGHQMVAHHYCEQVNEDFAQCALFDDDGEQARLNGIEYIISARVFESLPAEERAYWHPHNYEILSGQLVAPGLPDAAETAFMRGKMNSYGKTWQLWDTGAPGRAAAALPAGDPLLAWSLNRDGEADPALLDDYQRRQRIDPEKKRAERGELKTLARPQEGVDALKGRFGRDTRDLPGVQERKAQP
ncbi:MAG: OBAP family protein [Pseudomonadota bacterium]